MFLANIARWLYRRPKAWGNYLAFLIVGTLAWIFYLILNRTIVTGRENIPKRGGGVIFVANHSTMYDSFLLGIAGFFPSVILYPGRPPYNLPAEENFKRFFPFTFILSLLRVVYVRRGRRDVKLLLQLNRLISKHNFLIFYQGGRSLDLKQFKAWSIPFLISQRLKRGEPIDVVPVYHDGHQLIFGGGPGKRTWKNWVFRNPVSWIRRRLTVRFGKAIDFADLTRIVEPRERREAIKQRIVASIEALAKNERAKN